MKLDLPEAKHEKDYLEMVKEFTDMNEKIIPGAANLKEEETYQEFLTRIQRDRETGNPKHNNETAILYFLIDSNGKVVGAEHIRPILNEELRFVGGNIGYGIKPSERNKGYATIGLSLALEKCKELGIEKVMLTCKRENIGSSKTIKKNGGVRDSEYEYQGNIKERYRIKIK